MMRRAATRSVWLLALLMLACGRGAVPGQETEIAAQPPVASVPVVARAVEPVKPFVAKAATPARYLAFSPDGRVVVTATTEAKLDVWDVAAGSKVKSFAIPNLDLAAFTISPDGKTIAAVGFSGKAGEYRGVRRVDLESGKELAPLNGDRIDHISAVFSPGVAFSPDGRILAASAANDANDVVLWDAAGGKQLRTISVAKSGNNGAARLAFSPDGTVLASAGTAGVALWDVATGKKLRDLGGYKGYVDTIAFAVDGHELAGEASSAICFWDVGSGALARSVTKPNRQRPAMLAYRDVPEDRLAFALAARTAAFDADLNLLACAVLDLREERREFAIELWDTRAGRKIRSLEGHEDWVESLAVSPDGRSLASVSDDGTLRLWPIGAAASDASD